MARTRVSSGVIRRADRVDSSVGGIISRFGGVRLDHGWYFDFGSVEVMMQPDERVSRVHWLTVKTPNQELQHYPVGAMLEQRLEELERLCQ